MTNIRTSVIVVIIILFGTASLFVKQSVLDSKTPEIHFLDIDSDWGNIVSTEDAKKYMVFENIGTSDLYIEKITTSCGCTVAQWNKRAIKPFQKDSILVEYNTKNLGEFVREIMVFYNGESSPKHIFITGNVID